MYTILSYLKGLTCNAQFNFCFSSYFPLNHFFKAPDHPSLTGSALLSCERISKSHEPAITTSPPSPGGARTAEDFFKPSSFSPPVTNREANKRKLPETRLSKSRAPDQADAPFVSLTSPRPPDLHFHADRVNPESQGTLSKHQAFHRRKHHFAKF